MKFFRLMMAITGMAALLWVCGLLWFVSQVEARPPSPEHADAIVVLTGGTMRLAEGMRLLREGYGQQMLISGVADGVTLPELFKSRNESWPEDAELTRRIAIGYMARDTWGNAQEAARWMAENHFGSVVLVTSNYHMPRAELEFLAAMPEVELHPYPVAPGDVKIDDWWRFPGTRRLILSEYNKFIGVSLRLIFRWRST